MRNLDKRAITDFGIPSRILMENAGKGCAELLMCSFADMLRQGTVILCGHGNNGGDGYVIARWLSSYDIPVYIIKIGNGKSSPETSANLQLCKKIKQIEFIQTTDEDYQEYSESVLSDAGVIIDAVFGIGFKGNLKGEVADLITEINSIPALKVAIDIPSGVDADTGYTELAFRADVTLTMESLKFGHVLGQGKKLSGITEVIPIGIPAELWQDEDSAILLDENTACLPIRSKFGHKGDFGRIAVFAGSPGFIGAAFLATSAALKAGAGLVTIFAPPGIISVYDNKPYEVMVQEIPVDNKGKIDEKALINILEKYDVILFGPGCGVSDYTYQLLKFIIKSWKKPAVIDADGLNTLAMHPEMIAKLEGKQFVLTPHWGEFCRLAMTDMQALYKDCLSSLKKFVEQNKLNVLLKSHTSIYYDTETMYVNISGNDGLATGGSGDVLSGLIAGFLAQKMAPAEAAGMAAYFLGMTAELMAERQETFSIIPSDILNSIFQFNPADRNNYDTEE